MEAGTDSETSWAKVRLDAYDTVVDVSRRRLRVGDRVGIRWHPAEPATAVRLDRTTATLSILILLELVLVAYQMAALVRIGMVIHQALCMALLIGCAVVAITGGVAAATGHS